MQQLLKTQYELQEFRSDKNAQQGMHMGNEVAINVPGTEVGEVLFNPAIHPVAAINPLSIMESATGVTHVTQIEPYRPIELNVVVHQNPSDRDMPDYLQPIRDHKRMLAIGLMAAIGDSRQVMDETNLFAVGDTTVLGDLDGEAEVIEGTEDDAAASQAIAAICSRGLTFVISDFNSLDLAQPGGSYRETIAVKANHQLEVKLPPNVGRVTVGGLSEVNTGKPKPLKEFNASLASKHLSVERALTSAGLTVARVIYDNASSTGVNSKRADTNIAAAVQTITRR